MEKLKILTFHNLNIYQTLIFMYKFSKKLLPANFDSFFKKRESSKYNLRSTKTQKLLLPKNTCKYVEHSLSYRGPKLWNIIDEEIKDALSITLFKILLKIFLLNN